MRRKNLLKMMTVVTCTVLVFTSAIYGDSGADPVVPPETEETITVPVPGGPKFPGGPIVTPFGDPDPD